MSACSASGVGVPYPQAAIGVVRAELPPHAARGLALSNRLIDGSEALQLGLVDEALPSDTVLPRAMELAAEMAAFPVDVYAATKFELRDRTLGAMKAAVEAEPLLGAWLSPNSLPD
jgi:enoyl-CoA hydratase